MQIVKKQSSTMGELEIKPINKYLARELIIRNHYSHKWNDGGFGKFNYGIFKAENPDKCLGVAVYGFMKSPKANIFTSNNPKGWICELNRMWVDDVLGKNAETILISASLKLLRKTDKNIVAVQSFADGRLGCGTIYKAANFNYYGFHLTTFARSRRTGEIIHQQIFTNSTSTSGFLRTNVGYLTGEFDYIQVKTYRYIYIFDKRFKFFKAQKPYPEYEKGEMTFKWIRNKELIKEKIKRIIETL